MNRLPADVDKSIEELVIKAQGSLGIVASNEIDPDGIYTSFMRSKMIAYRLIEKAEDGSYFVLTERGWLFETFALEKKQFERERYLKNHAYWRAKLWLVFIIIGFIIGLLTPLLTDLIKTKSLPLINQSKTK